jgi:hypothetical protein
VGVGILVEELVPSGNQGLSVEDTRLVIIVGGIGDMEKLLERRRKKKEEKNNKQKYFKQSKIRRLWS